jgi:hypothetical protein
VRGRTLHDEVALIPEPLLFERFKVPEQVLALIWSEIRSTFRSAPSFCLRVWAGAMSNDVIKTIEGQNLTRIGCTEPETAAD